MKPNFFIVGAPKCGTTALATHLSQHPDIFMSDPKEPHYFADDFPHYKAQVPDLESYLKLFNSSDGNHSAIGEASVYYLYSHCALINIRHFCPDARIIAMLRNPVDLAYSLHSQLVWTLDENEKNFVRAWSLQERRQAGRDLPPRCRQPRFLQYGKVALLGEQVGRLLSIFPESQVKLIFFDDLCGSIDGVYGGVLDFLGVPADDRRSFPVVNANKVHRSQWAASLLQRPPGALVRLLHVTKRALNIERIGLVRKLALMNSDVKKRPPLDPVFRQELVDYFSHDIGTLEQLTGRPLCHWRR